MDEKELESALDEIAESINKENILQAPPIVEFRGPHSESLEYYLEEQMSQLTLEVTEKCNLVSIPEQNGLQLYGSSAFFRFRMKPSFRIKESY